MIVWNAWTGSTNWPHTLDPNLSRITMKQWRTGQKGSWISPGVTKKQQPHYIYLNIKVYKWPNAFPKTVESWCFCINSWWTTCHIATVWTYEGPPKRYLWSKFEVLTSTYPPPKSQDCVLSAFRTVCSIQQSRFWQNKKTKQKTRPLQTSDSFNDCCKNVVKSGWRCDEDLFKNCHDLQL